MVARIRTHIWSVLGTVVLLATVHGSLHPTAAADGPVPDREFNDPYTGRYLDRVAFPIGGMGAGMFCLEGKFSITP
jgi:hypothetical protein